MLLIIVASLGAFIILYSLFRHFTGLALSESNEKIMMDIIIFSALGLFLYGRKLKSDERKAKEAADEAERQAAEEPDETPAIDDDDLPHWERDRPETAS